MDLTKENYFELLSGDALEKSKKGKFDYASWSDVWDFLKKKVPDASFEWVENQYGTLGLVDNYGCFAKVRVWSEKLGVNTTMYLHAMDYSNKAIKKENLTASEINKTYQRCMVKAIAVGFGLGLYIYKGEDLPDEQDGKNNSNDNKKESKVIEKTWLNYEDFASIVEAGNTTEQQIAKIIEEDGYKLSTYAKKAVRYYLETGEIDKNLFYKQAK